MSALVFGETRRTWSSWRRRLACWEQKPSNGSRKAEGARPVIAFPASSSERPTFPLMPRKFMSTVSVFTTEMLKPGWPHVCVMGARPPHPSQPFCNKNGSTESFSRTFSVGPVIVFAVSRLCVYAIYALLHREWHELHTCLRLTRMFVMLVCVVVCVQAKVKPADVSSDWLEKKDLQVGSVPPPLHPLMSCCSYDGISVLKQGWMAKKQNKTVSQEDNSPILCEWTTQPIQIQDVLYNH